MKRRSLLAALGVGVLGAGTAKATVPTEQKMKIPTDGTLHITNTKGQIVFSVDDKGNLYMAGDVIKAEPTIDPIRKEYMEEQKNTTEFACSGTSFSVSG